MAFLSLNLISFDLHPKFSYPKSFPQPTNIYHTMIQVLPEDLYPPSGGNWPENTTIPVPGSGWYKGGMCGGDGEEASQIESLLSYTTWN